MAFILSDYLDMGQERDCENLLCLRMKVVNTNFILETKGEKKC